MNSYIHENRSGTGGKEYIFVSHSSRDTAEVRQLVEFLEASGIPCWVSYRDIPPGADWAETIYDAIEASSGMLLLYSENTNRSRQVRNELDIATNAAKTTILEARDKTKAGYQVDEGEGLVACFGVRLIEGEQPIPLQTEFSDKKCKVNEAIELPYVTAQEDNIAVKEIELGGNQVSDFEFFFSPPNADIVFENMVFPSEEPYLKITMASTIESLQDDVRFVTLDMVTKTVSLSKPQNEDENEN